MLWRSSTRCLQFWTPLVPPTLARQGAPLAQNTPREFREVALMCAVYNIKKAAKQEIPLPSCA
jgi:hypothetical protein